jgi:hypothetical protein
VRDNHLADLELDGTKSVLGVSNFFDSRSIFKSTNGGRPMVSQKRIALVVLWALSLIIVGALAHAQTPAQRNNAPTIITGSDIGFRVERQQGDRVTGTFIVRINGIRHDAEPAAGAKALSFK